MAPFFSDTFTENAGNTELDAHTPDLGTGWTRVLQDSTAVISAISTGDTAQVPANVADSGVVYTADETYPSADYEVQFTFVNGSAVATRPMYVGVRWQDASNVYVVRMINDTSGFRLWKKVGGTWSALGTAVTVATGSVVKLQIIGTALKLFDDTVEVQSVTDGDITGTGKAILAAGGGTFGTASTDDANSVGSIDDFSITDLDAGGGGDPEVGLIGGKLIRGGLLLGGLLTR